MLRNYLIPIVLLAFLSAALHAQTSTDEIRDLLTEQSMAWNEGDIDGFMEGYIKGPDLHFLGKSGLTSGWLATLERYKKVYPDTNAMGTLDFDIHEITRRTEDAYTVVGQYHLTRATLDDLSGYFLLVVINTKDGWRIVADSTH